MGNFTILVVNKSGASREYFLFVKPPTIAGEGNDVFQNVYIAAGPTPDITGTAWFYPKKEFGAVTGTAPTPLAPGVNVSTSDAELVALSTPGSRGTRTYMTVDEGGPRFMREKNTPSVSQLGSLGITTDKSFNFPNQYNIFIGVGAQNPKDANQIIPIATFAAQPNKQTVIQPHYTYYIAWGNHSAGDIIDTTTVVKPAEIDFTSKRASLCKVVHNDDGSWTVTYN